MPLLRVLAIRPLRWALFTLLVSVLGRPSLAIAQSGQEKIMQQRLERAGTLNYEPAAKAFSTSASVGNRQATVRSFAFGGRTAGTRVGDGKFRARAFNDGRGKFRTDDFSVRRAALADQALPQADRTFATGAVPVREDRAANKPVSTRDYVNSAKPFLVPGKRQDTIDELRLQPNLSVDQVREILNKSR